MICMDIDRELIVDHEMVDWVFGCYYLENEYAIEYDDF